MGTMPVSQARECCHVGILCACGNRVSISQKYFGIICIHLKSFLVHPQILSTICKHQVGAFLLVDMAHISGLAAALPDNLHLLTVHAWGPASVLVRLAHLFEKGEDPVLSLPTTVSLSTLFSGARLSGCVEMTVPASQPLAAVRVRTVEVEGEGQSTYPTVPPPPAGPTQDVVVSAMEVRSFMCSFA